MQSGREMLGCRCSCRATPPPGSFSRRREKLFLIQYLGACACGVPGGFADGCRLRCDLPPARNVQAHCPNRDPWSAAAVVVTI